MSFWLLTMKEWDYDDVISLVVLAVNEQQARETAARWCTTPDADGDKPGGNDPASVARAYLHPEYSTCEEISLSDAPKVVHYNRRHG